MPFTQIPTIKDDHILFIGDGSICNADEFFDWCMTSIRMAQEQGLNKLLYDNRTLTLELTHHDIMTVSEVLMDMDVQLLGLRFAVVSSRKTFELSQFVETSFINRSATYKRFDSQKEALAWLIS